MKLKKLFAVAFLLLLAASMHAQTIQSNITNISLSTTIGETLSGNCSVASLVLSGTPSGFNCTVTYNLNSNRSTIDGVAFFSSAVALSSPAGNIPASAINAVGGGNNGPCNMTATFLNTPFSNACPPFLNLALTPTTTSGSQTIPVSLAILNFNTWPPSNAYSGSINVEFLAQ